MTDEQNLFEGDFVRIKRRGRWEFVERVNADAAAVIVAVTDDRELVLVEQPRAPVNRPVIELPAGLIGDIAGQEDEPFERAAERELEEETGYAAGEWQYLMTGPPTPGLANEYAAFYLARGLSRVGAGGGDELEQITPHSVPLSRIHDWLAERRAEGVLVDPKVYAGIHFAERGGC